MQEEKIVETKTCKHCNSQFEITDKDLEFYNKVSPSFGGKKYNIPTPTLCPDCRQQRRLSFRNERKLYKRKCDATGREIISNYSPDKPYKVYGYKEWWSDKWDAMDYGKNFDFTRGFFEQYYELFFLIPQVSLIAIGNENCSYSNFAGYNKNCYLCFDYGWNNDCSYISKSYKNSNSIDLFSCLECEDSYGLIDCYKCIKCINCRNTENSRDCNYCFNCSGCNNCFLCFNLSNKSYYIKNIKYSKEEYFKKVKELELMNYNELSEEFNNLINKSIHKYNNNLSCENVLGDYLKESLNAYHCYNSQKCKDVKFVNDSILLENSYDDFFSGNNTFLTLETLGCENLNNSCFCYSCWQGKNNIYYSYFCHNSSNLFGCVGLKNKQYCILNKQYTKEEYEKLVPKIIEHMTSPQPSPAGEGVAPEWGEFFPSSISPFGYNETVAQEYFSITKEEAEKKGFNWSEYEPPFPKVEKIIPASKLPDNIKDIPDDILNWAIECEVTKKPFRIIKQELEFYRKHNLPIPRKHPDQRHLDRMSLRNPRKLFDRKCDKCGKEIKTTYSSDRKEIVYCEECYNKEIY